MVMGHLLTGVTMAQTGPSLAGCPVLPADNVWNTPIDGLPIDPNSEAYIVTIGEDRGVHPDFGSGLWEGAPIGIPYNIVPGTQPKVKITFDYEDESDPGPYPIPPGAEMEGGYNSDGDRHILVLDEDHCILYETWSTYPQADGSWHAGSGAIFDLQSNALRPSGWTSADAAGLPILPGLVRYDEVASGEIRHAIRFTVPKTRAGGGWPARHYASNLTELNYPPMGQRFRLKTDFDISGFSPTVQVILRALKRYGMILADNGSAWFISGAPDSRWNNDVLVEELGQVKGSDFEAVDESSLMIDPDSGQARQEGPGVLFATPADGFSSSGNSGGPFSPPSKAYTLQNTGGSSVDWTASKTQTWVTLSSGGGTLAAGASATVTVSINSSADSLSPGQYTDTVTFANTTNGTTTRSVSLAVNTPSVINISVTPTSVNLGNVNVGQSVNQTITITNQSSSTAALTGSVDTLSAPFSVVSGEGVFNLSPGQSLTVTVQFSPTMPGTVSAVLFITHNAANQDNPVLVTLSRTGMSTDVPVISVAPISNDYGNVKVKRSKSASFKITNRGKANLTISSTSIKGTDASMFAISGGGSKTIKPGKSLTIKVAFKPTSTGPKSATLEITSNDPVTPTVDISLSGAGQ